MSEKVRHLLGISGGKDSAALAIYLRDKYPQLNIDFYTCDTKCELAETENLIKNLQSYLGHIKVLKAAEGSTEPTPFDHFLKISRGYLPSVQSRWCTQKMKLAVFEEYVGDDPTISYVGIRGDEDRDGYVSTKPNIQAIFPFRRNIWSIDVINEVLGNDNQDRFYECYASVADEETLQEASRFLTTPITKSFYYSKKLNVLLDVDVKTFNHAVFVFLKNYTDYPVGKLDDFPLLDNEDVLVKEDIFRILYESGVGVPAYYNKIDFEVDGKVGQYCRSRSGCYFCFFQQRIEWIWLYEQHPDLFQKAMGYEKDGYTWIQDESLSDLIKPERIKQIKLEQIAKMREKKPEDNLLINVFDDDEIKCANCFI
ncbi:MAG: phosphoadenosine phosphosulfate reductase [bacterium]|nr:phosphoadenosine phosphosulfate reductase [Candidatus Limimorpha equi]